MPLDIDFLVDHFKNDLDYLSRNWRMLGRPICIFPVSGSMLGGVNVDDIGFNNDLGVCCCNNCIIGNIYFKYDWIEKDFHLYPPQKY